MQMLAEKVVLITGASGGIGLALIESFMYKVKKLISSSRKPITDLFALDNVPENYEHIPLDLTIEKNVEDLFLKIDKKFGRVDIVINTIGGSLFTHKIEDFPLDEFNQVLSVNLTSAFLITKYAIRSMKKNEHGGNIVHIVSSAAKAYSQNKAPYGIAKAGLARLIQYAAYEISQYNIKINGVSPTYVFTPRHEQDIEEEMNKTKKSKEEIVQSKIRKQLIKKPMHPEDLIPVIELLCETNAITGQIYDCTMGEVINY
jgi:3-hydroxybutyrate dehydrogenase